MLHANSEDVSHALLPDETFTKLLNHINIKDLHFSFDKTTQNAIRSHSISAPLKSLHAVVSLLGLVDLLGLVSNTQTILHTLLSRATTVMLTGIMATTLIH